MKEFAFVLILVSMVFAKTSQGKDHSFLLNSTDSALQAEIRYTSGDGKVSYRLQLANDKIINWSPLGLILEQQDLSQDLTLINAQQSTFNDQYHLMHGKQSSIHVDGQRLNILLTRPSMG